MINLSEVTVHNLHYLNLALSSTVAKKSQPTTLSPLPRLMSFKGRDIESNESTPILNGLSRRASVEDFNDVEKSSSKSPSLLWALAKVFGPTLLQAHVCKIIADVLTFIGPALQR